ncbi:MAG: hypothetical protein QOG31_1406 [Thermoplasmata archaeon]|jgi:hypothetical protein|nr:hypothetical protein [Thermoplasmata archaeon]
MPDVRALIAKGNVRIKTEGNVAVGTVDTLLLPFNPLRVALVVVNNEANAAHLRRRPGGSLTGGVRLDAVGGSIVKDYEHDGKSIQGEFWVNLDAASGNLYVEELEAYE